MIGMLYLVAMSPIDIDVKMHQWSYFEKVQRLCFYDERDIYCQQFANSTPPHQRQSQMQAQRQRHRQTQTQRQIQSQRQRQRQRYLLQTVCQLLIPPSY